MIYANSARSEANGRSAGRKFPISQFFKTISGNDIEKSLKDGNVISGWVILPDSSMTTYKYQTEKK